MFQNAATGGVVDWTINDGAVTQGNWLGTAEAGWNVAGTGDFNGDGTTDILFQNAATGGVVDWLMNKGAVSGGGIVGLAASGWSIT